MKKFSQIMMVIVLLLSVSAVLAACGSLGGNSDQPTSYGSEIDKTKYEKATVDGILTSPTDEFFDKDVMVDAIITKICPAGCWFYIKDYTADNSATVELYITNFKDRFLVPESLADVHVQVWGHVEADVKNNILSAVRMEIVK